MTIKEKSEEIGKIFNNVAPTLCTTLQNIIPAFLEGLSFNDGNFQIYLDFILYLHLYY